MKRIYELQEWTKPRWPRPAFTAEEHRNLCLRVARSWQRSGLPVVRPTPRYPGDEAVQPSTYDPLLADAWYHEGIATLRPPFAPEKGPVRPIDRNRMPKIVHGRCVAFVYARFSDGKMMQLFCSSEDPDFRMHPIHAIMDEQGNAYVKWQGLSPWNRIGKYSEISCYVLPGAFPGTVRR